MKNKFGKLLIAASLGMLATTMTNASASSIEYQAVERHHAYGMNKRDAEARFLSWVNGRQTSYSCFEHYYQGVLAYGYCSGTAY